MNSYDLKEPSTFIFDGFCYFRFDNDPGNMSIF